MAFFAIALIAVATILGWGVRSRLRARTALNSETAQVARQAVSVVSPKRTAWLTGQMSPLAKKNFQALGWNVHEKTKLLTQASRATRGSGEAMNEGANRLIASDRQWASSDY